MPLLKIENLSVNFRSNNNIIKAVKNVSFNINKGELVALVGESGSGKSVTALSVMKLLPYPIASHPTGVIYFQDKDILSMTEKEVIKLRGSKISMIFQEPMTSLNPLHSIERQITEVLLLHKKMTAHDAKKRCIELIELVGLSSLKNRLNSYPHKLSGGQRQRVMIAMALACEPDLLIADEPTTALDVTVQSQILSLLKELQKKLGMAILLITHDLTIVRQISDYVCVMKDGEIVEQNKTEKLFKNPEHKYTQTLLASEIKDTAKPIKKSSPQLLTVNDLNVSFPLTRNFFGKVLTSVSAVKNSSFDLKIGETLGIVGESGSGKSTIAFAILKLITSQGVIKFQNERIDTLNGNSFRPLRKEMQIVFQDPFASLNPRMSVAQIIEEGLLAHNIGGNKKERDELICKTLEEVEMDIASRFRYPHEFSGGQRQRIAIARALVLNPKLIILDEPTSALDLTVQAKIIALLRKLQKEKNISYIFISHDLRVIRAISHKIIVMKDGKIVESGETQSLLQNASTEYTAKLISSASLQ